MARTIDAIYNEIQTAKAATPELVGLNSTSRTSVYNLWAYITAVVIWALEKMWDAFSAEVDDRVAKAVPGIPAWYARKALEFQFGDNLQFVNDVPQYAVVDQAKRIVKRVSVATTDEGEALIKVAKLNGSNVIALSNAELTAFRAYIRNIQFAGTKVRVSSLNTDYLRVQMSVFYNPLFDLNTMKTAVETAVNGYLANLTFDGVVTLSRIVDAVQAVAGVNDVVLSLAQARTNTGAFAAIARTYQTQAGYIQVDPATPLSNTITYVPN